MSFLLFVLRSVFIAHICFSSHFPSLAICIAVTFEDKLASNATEIDHSDLPILWPMVRPSLSTRVKTTKPFTYLVWDSKDVLSRTTKNNTRRTQTFIPIHEDLPSEDEDELPDDERPTDSEEQRNESANETDRDEDREEEEEEKPDTPSLDSPVTDASQRLSTRTTRTPTDLQPKGNLSAPDSDGTVLTQDTIQSDLEGRTNLSSSSPGVNAPYFKTSPKPGSSSPSEDDSPSSDESNDDSDEFDSKGVNGTRTPSERLFSEDEIRAYLQGRTNLSETQQEQIRLILSKSTTKGFGTISKHSTSTAKSSTFLTPDDQLSKLLAYVSQQRNRAENSTTFTLSENDIRAYVEGRTNLSASQQEQIRLILSEPTLTKHPTTMSSTTTLPVPDDYLSKFLSYVAQHSNGTHNVTKISVSEDDVRAYVEGRGNLTESQQEQIRLILSEPPASELGIVTRNPTSTKPTLSYSVPDDYLSKFLSYVSQHSNATDNVTKILVSEDDVRAYVERRGNLSESQKEQIRLIMQQPISSELGATTKHPTSVKPPSSLPVPDDYLSKFRSYLSQQNNGTDNLTKVMLSEEDVRAYVEGRGNLSESQQAQIRFILSDRASSDFGAFTKPSTISILDNSLSKFLSYLSKNANGTDNVTKIIVSQEDIRAYVEGRGNLSESQQEQIKLILEQAISSEFGTPTKYPTSTKPPSTFSIPDDYLSKFQFYLSQQRNGTDNLTKGTISEEDIRAYVEGRTDLSASQQEQIRLILSDPASSGFDTPTKRLTSTRKTSTVPIPDDALSTLLFYLSKLNNGTDNQTKITISEDDVRAYVEGRGNLSESQQEQIRLILQQPISNELGKYTKHPTSVQPPSSLPIPDDYLSRFLYYVLQQSNGTDNVTKILVSEDDVRAYVEGRGNLSESQRQQIRLILQQPISDEQRQNEPDRKTPAPSIDDGHYDDQLSRLLSHISKQGNHSGNATTVMLSEDDVRAYVEGRANLSESQQAQIQRILSDPALSEIGKRTKYTTSTSTISTSSIAEDFLSKYFWYVSKHANRTDNVTAVMVSDEDVRAYIEGRGNLSKSQQEEIKLILSQPVPSTPSRSTKYPTITNPPSTFSAPDDYLSKFLSYLSKHNNGTDNGTEIIVSPDDVHAYLEGRGNLSESQQEQIKLILSQPTPGGLGLHTGYSTSKTSLSTSSSTDDYISKLISYASKHLNRTSNGTDGLLSEDIIRSYLQGRDNLSPNEEALFQNLLSKNASERQNILAEYASSTGKPISHGPMLFSEETIRSYLEGRANLTDSEKVQLDALLSKELASNSSVMSKYLWTTTTTKSTEMLPFERSRSTIYPYPPTGLVLSKFTPARPFITRRPGHSIPPNTGNGTGVSDELDDHYDYHDNPRMNDTDEGSQFSTPNVFFSRKQPSSTHKSNLASEERVTQFQSTPIGHIDSINANGTASDSGLTSTNDTERSEQATTDRPDTRRSSSATDDQSIDPFRTVQPDGSHRRFSLDFNVTAIPYPFSPFSIPYQTVPPSHHVPLSSPLHGSLAHSSTEAPESRRSSSSSSALLSVSTPPATMIQSGLVSSDDPNVQTTSFDIVPSTILPEQSSVSSKKPPLTPKTKYSKASVKSSPKPRTKFTGTTTARYRAMSPTRSTDAIPGSSSTPSPDKVSTFSTDDDENLALPPDQSREVTTTRRIPFISPPSVTHRVDEEFIPNKPPFERTSTVPPLSDKSPSTPARDHPIDPVTDPWWYQPFPSTRPPLRIYTRRRSSKRPMEISTTTTSTVSTTTTVRPYRSRKQKIIRWQTRSSTSLATTSILPVYQPTTVVGRFSYFSPRT